MKNTQHTIRKPELYFHIAFWIMAIAGLMNTGTAEILFLNGLFYYPVILPLPVYIISQLLIPKYLNRDNKWTFAFYLMVTIAVVSIFRALVFAFYVESISGESFEFKNEFIKWLTKDFTGLDKFLFGTTAQILYLSFGYRFIKDWFVNKQVNDNLKAENHALETALTRPSEIKDFLTSTARFADRFSVEGKLVGDYFFVNTGTEKAKVRTKDIQYIEGNGNYVNYHLGDKKIMERSSIKETLSVLPKSDFVQIQRSYIVALSHVDKIQDNHVHIGESKISIGPNFKDRFKNRIGDLSLKV